MSRMQYPTTIQTQDGAGLIFEGHGLDEAALLDRVRHDMDPSATGVGIEEDWFHFYPRIKNCADYGGPCDLEGDWHKHWAPVRKGQPGTEFTIAYPQNEETPR